MEIMMSPENVVSVVRVPSLAIIVNIHSFKKNLLSGKGIILDTISH